MTFMSISINTSTLTFKDANLRYLLKKTNDNLYYSNSSKFGTHYEEIYDNIMKNDDFKAIDNDLKHSKAFGFIFEKMVTYELVRVAQENNYPIHDVAHSIGISFLGEDTGNDDVDQFDSVMLLKSGKLIIFECKSGSVDTDAHKSHRYSTYAASGVFGLPILILPILEKEKEILKKYNKKSLPEEYAYMKKEQRKVIDKFKINVWDNIFSKFRSALIKAEHANLEVWGLDEIETKLQDLLEI
jgi:hypothetical protein